MRALTLTLTPALLTLTPNPNPNPSPVDRSPSPLLGSFACTVILPLDGPRKVTIINDIKSGAVTEYVVNVGQYLLMPMDTIHAGEYTISNLPPSGISNLPDILRG